MSSKQEVPETPWLCTVNETELWAGLAGLWLVALIVLVLVTAVGCGGGQMAPAPPVPQPVPNTPTVSQTWKATDLPPLLGTQAAQAQALNSKGIVMGYSVTNDGLPRVTKWVNATPTDLGPGVATGINDGGHWSGWRNGPGFTTVAMLDGVDLPLLTGYDSALAMGINRVGTVVGIAYNSSDSTQEQGVSWSGGEVEQVQGCAVALAINGRGQIAGISDRLNATVCGMPDYGVSGAATAINSSGVTVGYGGSVTAAYRWPATQIAASAQATGINDWGWVTGETITPVGAPQARVKVAGMVVFNPHLAGISHPWIWSEKSGLVMLQGVVATTAINGKQIVGAAVTSDGFVHGVLLEGQ